MRQLREKLTAATADQSYKSRLSELDKSNVQLNLELQRAKEEKNQATVDLQKATRSVEKCEEEIVSLVLSTWMKQWLCCTKQLNTLQYTYTVVAYN